MISGLQLKVFGVFLMERIDRDRRRGPLSRKPNGLNATSIGKGPTYGSSTTERRHLRPSPSSVSARRTSANIRIVVADDHPVVRFGVKNMLQAEEGFEVVGEAEDGDTAITQTLELEPDILLLDLHMPRLPGLDAMRAIMTKSPPR